MCANDSSIRTQATESISFRLNVNDLNQLRDLARQRKESLNSLVAQIIDKYVKLWIFDQHYGFFSVGRGVLQASLAKLDDEEIEEIAKDQVARAHKAIITNLYGKVNKETVVTYFDVFCSRFETFKHFREGSTHKLVVYHGADSLQFSKLYYAIGKSILELAKIETLEAERDLGTDSFAIGFEASV